MLSEYYLRNCLPLNSAFCTIPNRIYMTFDIHLGGYGFWANENDVGVVTRKKNPDTLS